LSAWHHLRIPFVGLKNGVHYFNFEVDDDFFARFENSLVQRGKVFVDLALDRRNRTMTLDFDIAGRVHTECDRCLAEVEMPIHGHHKLYVKLERHEDAPIEDDVLYLSPEETHLDLTEPIYEFTLLSLPLQRTCTDLPEAERPCDWDVIRKLEGKTAAPTASEAHPEDEHPPIDPRWAKLRDLSEDAS
jgi:uncharacterized metal-binding protein YceD (DUF177 family)